METITRWVNYFKKKADRAFDELSSELSENRTILVWVFSLAFLALVFYTAVNNPLSHNTSIMTLGSIVGTCFSCWVVVGSSERKERMKLDASVDMSEEEQEEASGD